MVVTKYGFAGNPVTGDLLATILNGHNNNSFGLAAINPLTGVATVINNTADTYDGVSVSRDGTIVYVADVTNSHVLGFNILTHAQVFDSGVIPGVPDGTGVISGGAFDGYIVANTNTAGVFLIKPDGTSAVQIASGGSRGDFTSPDLSNGTLLVTDLENLYRLSIAGGTIGGGGSVPEPASLAIWSLGALSCVVAGYRRRKQTA
jgi:sugar lactone lactonase YvrE